MICITEFCSKKANGYKNKTDIRTFQKNPSKDNLKDKILTNFLKQIRIKSEFGWQKVLTHITEH